MQWEGGKGRGVDVGASEHAVTVEHCCLGPHAGMSAITLCCAISQHCHSPVQQNVPQLQDDWLVNTAAGAAAAWCSTVTNTLLSAAAMQTSVLLCWLCLCTAEAGFPLAHFTPANR